MIRRLACAALTIGIIATAAPAWAQSLGDVARKEQARRATAKKAVKSFSNADLAPSEISDPAPPPAATPSATSGADAASKEATAAVAAQNPPDQKQPEQKESDWRANAEDIRAALAKAQAEFTKVNADANDPNKSPGERTAAARHLATVQKFIDRREREWQDLEKQAVLFGVPRGWLDPRPILSGRTQR